MTYAFHWRKAITVSVCLHIFMVVTAGYLVASLPTLTAIPEEIVLEMDLVSDPGDRANIDPGPPAPVVTPPPPQPVPAEPVPAEPMPVEAEAKPVITTSELSVSKVERPAVPAAGQPQAATNTGSGSGTGSGSAGTPGAAGGIAAPGILSKVDPHYPPAARKAGQEGTVLLRIQILANGRPGEISIARSTGYEALDAAAAAAVRKWQFVPAKDRSSGRTVACTTTMPVSFRLRN
ncbi:energy transducer TonB [Sporomusa termitida]|uniref:TonB C-terminal domain-containing protein n=1 Tax=Sporomusa termitida TaxID=2377 RepID=A0A517E0F1_9FIRM|nr:energy transducer TonB [Sporomusa termitida]QDR82976.1 hypothetical protein SPTER_44290 [Sporomusa termitida]